MDLNSSRIDTTAPTKKPYGEILKDDYVNSYDAFKEGGWGPQEVAQHAYNISQAKGVDVRQQAADGEAVGERNAKGQEITDKGEAEKIKKHQEYQKFYLSHHCL